MRTASSFRRHSGITAFELQLPEDLTGLDDEALATLEEQGVAEFDELFETAGDAPSPEQLAAMETLRDQIAAVRSESGRRSTEASERAATLAGLRDAVHGGDAPAADDDGAAPAAPAAADAPVDEPVAVAASGTPAAPAARPSLGSARSAAPVTPTRPAPADAAPRYTLVASAPFGSTGAGDTIDFATAARMFENSMRGLRGVEGKQPFQVAATRLAFPENLVASSYEGEQVEQVLAYAADESRLQGGSLTAAGTGWAAVSEIDYTVNDDGSSLAGLVSVPEVGIARGGIKFYLGADFASIYADGFYQTEADNIAGTAKTFTSVPAPTAPTEERLDAIGLGVTSGILARVGFPEQIDQFMRQSLIGHQHRVSAKTIAKMEAKSTAVDFSAWAHSASVAILEALEISVLDMRQRHVLQDTETIEVLLPYWVKGVIRADYAKRNAVDSPLAVTDAMISEWFTIRGCAVQFTYDWQSKLEGGVAFGDTAVAAVAYPATVKALMYRAGTFVRGLEDVITINGLYDSALLAQNNELGLFTEQGLLVAKRGFDARVATIGIVADGTSASQAAVGF